ncbi:hypothetical protein DFJ73DRAFT_933645, partial [Zopfochytrium polystomum]
MVGGIVLNRGRGAATFITEVTVVVIVVVVVVSDIWRGAVGRRRLWRLICDAARWLVQWTLGQLPRQGRGWGGFCRAILLCGHERLARCLRLSLRAPDDADGVRAANNDAASALAPVSSNQTFPDPSHLGARGVRRDDEPGGSRDDSSALGDTVLRWWDCDCQFSA